MMNVQKMRLIVDALHNGAIPGAAQRALQLWGGDSLVYVRSSANHIFRFIQGDRQRFLRLAHTNERSIDFLQAEIDFIQHLAHAG